MPYSGLFEHSEKVADDMIKLLKGTGFDFGALPYKIGILHDIGKLNPFYQELFKTDQNKKKSIQERLANEYMHQHSIFSALFCYWLFYQDKRISEKELTMACSVILSHHSKLKQLSRGLIDRDHPDYKKFFNSRKAMVDSLRKIQPNLNNLGFDDDIISTAIDDFKNTPQPSSYKSSELKCETYVEFISLYSILLNADRGSFFDIQVPKFDFAIDTNVALKKGSLSRIRESFHDAIFRENKFDSNLLLLKAPTGIGKTRIFLDILNTLMDSSNFERVFYFSPLLTLTDDMETKLFGNDGKSISPMIKLYDPKEVLIYNHIFKGTLEKKEKDSMGDIERSDEFETAPQYKTKEWFETTSFNKKMIITTTQRFLSILYNNAADDKLKLLSFKNSFLIIDEVQTIPKFLLPNLLKLIFIISKKLNSKVLFISATVPAQIEEFSEIKKINAPSCLETEYLDKTLKKIHYVEKLDLERLASFKDGPNLIMVNTRKKAVEKFYSLSGSINKRYLSAGIIKENRNKIISEIKTSLGNDPLTLISTQVIEAGIDVDFKRIFREMAPLDNIIQIMGRLNREAKDSNAVLTVFEDDYVSIPYLEIEVKESRGILKKIESSKDLYSTLSEYYRTLKNKNKTESEELKELNNAIAELNFDRIWELISNNVFKETSKGIVFLPPKDQLDFFIEKLKNHPEKATSILNNNRKWTAELPISPYKIKDMLNQSLFEEGIYVPNLKHYSDLYDKNLGLDILLKSN